jgi:hypothetical protein
MPKPPEATPHSDIDGVRKNEKRNTDVADALGESAEQLARAKNENVARPPHSEDVENRDDRAQ